MKILIRITLAAAFIALSLSTAFLWASNRHKTSQIMAASHAMAIQTTVSRDGRFPGIEITSELSCDNQWERITGLGKILITISGKVPLEKDLLGLRVLISHRTETLECPFTINFLADIHAQTNSPTLHTAK